MHMQLKALKTLKTMRGTSLALLGAVGLASTVACGQVGVLKSRMTFREANTAYQSQDYKKAAQLYEEALKDNPELVDVLFFLGNCYDNQYKPALQGQPENDGMLTKAIENYEAAAQKLTDDTPDHKMLKIRSLQYLVAVYGSDKLDDPVRAEPIILRLIQNDPADPANYYQLGQLYEGAGVYDEAEKIYVLATKASPSDPNTYVQLAGYYDRQGEFEKKIAAFEQRALKEPNNPDAFYTMSVNYWNEAYKNARLSDAVKESYVQKGMENVDQALKLKPDYVEAMIYKGLLLRLQALFEKDPAKQQALLKQADTVRDEAQKIHDKKATGVS
jgi:tetratricopeptide (TPR) repeat protein